MFYSISCFSQAQYILEIFLNQQIYLIHYQLLHNPLKCLFQVLENIPPIMYIKIVYTFSIFHYLMCISVCFVFLCSIYEVMELKVCLFLAFINVTNLPCKLTLSVWQYLLVNHFSFLLAFIYHFILLFIMSFLIFAHLKAQTNCLSLFGLLL